MYKLEEQSTTSLTESANYLTEYLINILIYTLTIAMVYINNDLILSAVLILYTEDGLFTNYYYYV